MSIDVRATPAGNGGRCVQPPCSHCDFVGAVCSHVVDTVVLLYHYLALRCVHNLRPTQLATFASVLQGSESAVSQLERMLGNVPQSTM